MKLCQYAVRSHAQPFIYYLCSLITERRRNHMSTCTLLVLFMTALVWPKPVWEKSWAVPTWLNTGGFLPRRTQRLMFGKKRQLPESRVQLTGLCFLSLVPPNPPCESSMWKPNMHSEAWRSWSKQELCIWYACLGFHLLSLFLFSFLDVVIIFWKTLSNLCSLTPKFLHCPSVPFKMFPSDMFLHVTSLFSHIRYMSSMGRLFSPMFHDELKTKLATELLTYAFDFSSVGNFSKISTLCNTE